MLYSVPVNITSCFKMSLGKNTHFLRFKVVSMKIMVFSDVVPLDRLLVPVY